MNPKMTVLMIVVSAVCGLGLLDGRVRAQTPPPAQKSTAAAPEEKKPEGMSELEWEKMKAKRPLPFDKGPSSIDISNYSKEMQAIYTDVFVKTCSRCHTIARPINAPYSLPEEWNRYIKKMMKKPGSGINPEAARKIYRFLVYDSEIRKKEDIERKLKLKPVTDGGDR